MSRLQDLAQSILGYGKKSVDTYQKELPITQEITSRYTPQVALGAQLAGGEAQTPVRMASEFLKQRNLPGQSIVDALARYSENTPVKQASIKAYQGQPLTAQEQALLTENALQLVIGMNEPIKTGNKVQSLLKNKGILQTGTPEKQIQWMSDLAEAEQSLPAKVLKQIKSSTIPGSERTSAILQALEEVQTTPKVVKQALKIKRTDPLDALKVEARKYKTTVNLQDKNDLEYLERIFSKSTIEDILSGQKTNWRGESYEDLARVNFISETPKTIEQQLAGKIKDYKPASDTFYHGTSADSARKIMGEGFKSGTELPKDAYRGGGYGKIQEGVSFAETPKEAGIFSTLTRDGEIVEAKLKKGAKVVTIDGIEDAVDLADYTKYLKKQGIDAVYIGGGEKELVVLNTKAVTPVKSQLTDLYNQATKGK